MFKSILAHKMIYHVTLNTYELESVERVSVDAGGIPWSSSAVVIFHMVHVTWIKSQSEMVKSIGMRIGSKPLRTKTMSDQNGHFREQMQNSFIFKWFSERTSISSFLSIA